MPSSVNLPPRHSPALQKQPGTVYHAAMCMDDESRPMKRADLAERARQTSERLSGEGVELSPVAAAGKNLASHFWARAWMKHLAQSEIYGMRLAPGRTYLRYGCVIDLHIAPEQIRALVCGENLYEVSIRVTPPDEKQLELIRERCGKNISSWVDLLHGHLSEDVLEALCREDTGILPEIGNMQCSCTCPDWADICKHSAAALYGAGVRIDNDPSLLFILRGLSMDQLIPDKNSQPATDPPAPFNKETLSSLFDVNLED